MVKSSMLTQWHAHLELQDERVLAAGGLFAHRRQHRRQPAAKHLSMFKSQACIISP